MRCSNTLKRGSKCIGTSAARTRSRLVAVQPNHEQEEVALTFYDVDGDHRRIIILTLDELEYIQQAVGEKTNLLRLSTNEE